MIKCGCGGGGCIVVDDVALEGGSSRMLPLPPIPTPGEEA